jgi:glycosyltransferase involved in cell wall biosynthesis
MKILMLCYEYPPIGGGGAKVVHGLTSELINQGHEVDLVTMGYKNLPKYEKINRLNIYRVRCLRLKANICTPPEMITYLFFALPLLLKLCKKNNYDINHTHFIYPDGFLAYVLNKLTGLPFIITAHGSDVPGYNPNRFKLLHRILYPFWKKIANNSVCVICPSKSLQDLVLKADKNLKTRLLTNGIDLNKFSPNKIKKKRLLVVSRMFERKGIQYFLSSLKGLKHGFEVNIVGDGPYMEHLRRLASELNLNVNFLGYLDNDSEALKQLYETSMIFVLASETENFPIVLLEAMTAGLSIVTTDDSGCAEVVGDSGLLVPSKDILAIRNAILQLIEDELLRSRLGQAARKRVEGKFSWESTTKKYISLYDEVISSSGSFIYSQHSFKRN